MTKSGMRIDGRSDREHGAGNLKRPTVPEPRLKTVNEYSEARTAERERDLRAPGDLSLKPPSEMVQITGNIQILP